MNQTKELVCFWLFMCYEFNNMRLFNSSLALDISMSLSDVTASVCPSGCQFVLKIPTKDYLSDLEYLFVASSENIIFIYPQKGMGKRQVWIYHSSRGYVPSLYICVHLSVRLSVSSRNYLKCFFVYFGDFMRYEFTKRYLVYNSRKDISKICLYI